jgi:uncharacterized membrane protein YphA (DoxX/SURF4 family)
MQSRLIDFAACCLKLRKSNFQKNIYCRCRAPCPYTIVRLRAVIQWKYDPRDPDSVDVILEWRWTWPIARSILTLLFIVSAVVEIAAVTAQAHFGIYPPEFWAALTIIVQVTGSAIIITRRLKWLGAGILGVFTAATEVVAHRFWELSGQARFEARNEFFEHLGLVGGFTLVAVLAEERRRLRARALPRNS